MTDNATAGETTELLAPDDRPHTGCLGAMQIDKPVAVSVEY